MEKLFGARFLMVQLSSTDITFPLASIAACESTAFVVKPTTSHSPTSAYLSVGFSVEVIVKLQQRWGSLFGRRSRWAQEAV
jgi:hypothetical protein